MQYVKQWGNKYLMHGTTSTDQWYTKVQPGWKRSGEVRKYDIPGRQGYGPSCHRRRIQNGKGAALMICSLNV